MAPFLQLVYPGADCDCGLDGFIGRRQVVEQVERNCEITQLRKNIVKGTSQFSNDKRPKIRLFTDSFSSRRTYELICFGKSLLQRS